MKVHDTFQSKPDYNAFAQKNLFKYKNLYYLFFLALFDFFLQYLIGYHSKAIKVQFNLAQSNYKTEHIIAIIPC